MKSNLKKYLILGSNSFSGSTYINNVLKKNVKIIGISRQREIHEVMLPYSKSIYLKNFKFIKLDFNKEIEKLLEIVDSFKPEYIVNFAAQGEVRNSWLFPEQWYRTNCLSLVSFTNKLIGKKFIKKFLNISTPEVYGSTPINLRETILYNPSTPYAASKLAGDLHLNTLFKKYNFPIIFSRSANVFGPYQQLYRIIPRTIIYLKKNKKIDLHGGGKSKRSFIHINDVSNAYNLLIKKGNIGEVYHIAPKTNLITIKNLVKLICNKMHYDFKSSTNTIFENYGQDGTKL